MWRAADEALLSRLADEALIERAWALAAPGAAPLHPRAAGMIRLLRQRDGASGALEAAGRGDAAALLALATPSRLEGWPPALVHHLALFHRARLDHAVARDLAASAPPETLALVMACWLALGQERTYLRALAGDVIGSGLPEPEIARAAREAEHRGIEAVAAVARAGVEGLRPSGARALEALGRIEEACRIAALDAAAAGRARARASAASTTIVSAATEPLAIALEELAAREWTAREVAEVLERASDAWRWAGEDVEIERFVVRELPRFAWDLYREKRWDDLRSLLRPIEGPSDRLARRIESDPAQIAWAAQCSQVLVFRAELAPALDAQLALAERALRLCPTLRNARLVLADLLCARAERRLEQPLVLRSGDAWTSARADVDRAAEIFPELSRLPALRARVGRRGTA